MHLIERWAGDGRAWRCPNLANSIARFAIFNQSPEIIRLIVMMYLRSPLSLRNLQDLLFERGIDTFQETVRLWWNRFCSLCASDIRRQRTSRMCIAHPDSTMACNNASPVTTTERPVL